MEERGHLGVPGVPEPTDDESSITGPGLASPYVQDLKAELFRINEKLDSLLAHSNIGVHEQPVDTSRGLELVDTSRGLEPVETSRGLSRLQEVLAERPSRNSRACVRISTPTVLSRRQSFAKQRTTSSQAFTSPVFPQRTISSQPAFISKAFSSESIQEAVAGPHGLAQAQSVYGRRQQSSVDASRFAPSTATNMTKQEAEAAAARIIYRSRWLTCLDQVWNTLEDRESSTCAKWLAVLMPVFIVATVFLTLQQTLETPPLGGIPAACVEVAVDSLFLLEFLVRLAACPNWRLFFLNWYNIIDLAAAAPLVLRAATGFVLPPAGKVQNASQSFLLLAVPIVRLLKTLRRFEKFQLLLKAFSLAFEALPVLLFMLFIITLSFSVLIYLVEPRDNITSLSQAAWLTIVTMTTVGYGDVIPRSVAGSFVTGVLIGITVLYMAVPLGIIGNAFTQTWNDRDRILLTHRTRDRLQQWGYAASDIPILFSVSGGSSDDLEPKNKLNIDEFRALLKRMRVGFSDERIYQLFKSFDPTNVGTIDDRAFVRTLFPNAYYSIYK